MSADEKLSPARRLVIGAVVLAMAAGGFVAGRTLLRPSRAVIQPVEFSHRVHTVDLELECSWCHQHYETAAHSGLPAVGLCMDCHEGGVTESPEEKRLLELAEQEDPVAFRKLFRMPDHVYYSHRTHVAVADLACEICHGDVAATEAPPRTPLVRVTMDTCVDCHVQSGVQTDCTHCHR